MSIATWLRAFCTMGALAGLGWGLLASGPAKAAGKRFQWKSMLPYFSAPAAKPLRRALRFGRCAQAEKLSLTLGTAAKQRAQLMLGRCWLSRRKYAKARQAFTAVGKGHLLRDYLHFWIGQIHQKERKAAPAIARFLKVRRGALKYHQARLAAVRLLQQERKYTQALRELRPTSWRSIVPDVWWLGIRLSLRIKKPREKMRKLRARLARLIWSRAPSSAEARQVQAARRKGWLRFRPTLRDRLKRASQLNRIYDYRKALATLRRARLPRGASKSLRCRFYFARGYAWVRRRTYSRAIGDLSKAKVACKGHRRLDVRSLYWLGQANRRRGRDRAAAVVFRELATRFPSHYLADDALFLIADRLDRRGRKAQAQKVYREMMRRFPQGDMVSVARWRVAYATYRRGKIAQAVGRFRVLVQKNGRSKFAPRARYYWARGLEKMAWRKRGKARKTLRNKALGVYRQLVQRHPMHYYSFMALYRIQRRTRKRWKVWRVPLNKFLTATGRASISKSPPKLRSKWRAWVPWGPLPHRPPNDRELLQMFHGVKAPFLGHVSYRRGRMLYRLGFKSYAGAEWLRLRRCKILMPGTTRRRYGCGRRGDPGAQLLALHFHLSKEYYQANWAYRARGIPAGRMSMGVNFVRYWYLSYPKPYWKYVRPAVAVDKVDQGMVYGIMREESAFRPTTRSWANAYGLMQFIISTARSTARTLWPSRRIVPEDLYDPKTCIRLGVRHLLQLYRIFRGQYPLMAGAYNAGPGWVRRWLRRYRGLRFDEWNEAITIRQTRHYVRRVMQSFAIYRYLYHPRNSRWEPVPFSPHARPARLAAGKRKRPSR